MRSIKSRFRRALAPLLAILLAVPAWAQPSYPAIRSLRSEDPVYDQLLDSIESFHQGEKGGAPSPELCFYVYTTQIDVDIFSLAAALSLPYDTLATLNRLRSAETIRAGSTLLVPSLPGIFVNSAPDNDLEYLVKSLWNESPGPHGPVRAFIDGRYVDFTFYPGREFHASERTFFLVAGFRFPLPKGSITSGFGSRVDPFTGKSVTFHTGIDIGAPFGTRVFAARSGRIDSTGYSDVYGNFIVVAHDATWETLYGHLSKILAIKGQRVKTGDTIGLVGSTGMSTGPHLHFETRRRGVATDPLPLMMSH
jgi:murein DD-endopeptidase MepM/ murein hydrolase activator NlpD